MRIGQACTAAVVGALLGVGCDNRTAQSPTPTYYAWPDRLNYRMEHVAELQRQARPLQRFEAYKVLKLTVREDHQYVLVYDSVLKTSQVPGEPPRIAPYLPEDTLAFYVELGRLGELGRVVAGCDPALAACAAALPSAVAMEVRRMVPRLPVWPVPAGGTWEDTLRYDDAARPGGTRGTLITRYGPVRDTAMGRASYWMVPWRSSKQAFRRPPEGAGFAPEQPAEDAGLTLIDKQRLIPVFSTWAGAIGAPPELRAIGIEASAFRARVYLAGSPFDSAFAAEGARARPPDSAKAAR